MAGEKFKLNFISNGEGIVDIQEPIGIDAIEFNIKQKDKGYGRDVFFGGDEDNKFEFVSLRNHYIDTFLYYYKTFGWESQVQQIIEKDGIDNIIGDFSFQSAETNMIDKFSAKVVQDNNQAILKRRSELNVDVFSDENIDGEEIEGLTTENVLVKATPISKTSSWETPEAYTKRIGVDAGQLESDTEYFTLNPAIALKNFNIDDSLIPFQNFRKSETLGTIKNIRKSDFILIEAQDNLNNIEIDFSSLDYNLDFNIIFGSGHCDYGMEVRYGTDWDTAKIVQYFSGRLENGQSYKDTNNYKLNIDYLNRGDKIWFYFTLKINALGRLFSGSETQTDITINSLNIDAKATRLTYNTIVPSIRLYDGVSQVVKSISGLETSFPFAEPNGEMYNQRLFNGNLLRNLTDKPFNVSLDKIEKWLPEINGDFELSEDAKVFFGLYKDFYTNKEIAVFTGTRFDGYNDSMNQRYAINQFSYKYKKYQSQKENEIENSFDIAHGESQWSVLNKFAENKKEINVEFVRDSILIDEQRRKSFVLSDNTSTQDDETIFILDSIKLTEDLTFEETDFLQHTYNEDTGYLKITNTGTFNFELLGIAVGESFNIIDDTNEGNYTVIEVTPRYIVIDKGSGGSGNNGERITKFKYTVSTTTAPYISRGNEGFSVVDGLINIDGFANLKYTIKRNIERFYGQYLATCNIFANKPIKNTLYQNNRELELVYDGVRTKEVEEFTPKNPILMPYVHKIEVIIDFNDFIALRTKIKTDRGYFRFFNNNGHFIKGYIKEASFRHEGDEGVMTCEVEEKYDTSLINIDVKQGYLSINDEYTCRKIQYEIRKESVYIKDEDGFLFYHPVFWQKVTINGASFNTKNKLIEGLNLLI